MKGKPRAFTSDMLNVFWETEPWDAHVPEGFLSDFVTSVRGIETPTKFALWSGIFILSSALKRESYINWYPAEIYPNFYIVLVAPPRINAKTTVVNYGESKVLSSFHKVYPDRYMQELKRVNIERKATPEALGMALLPESKHWIESGQRCEIDRGSQISLIVSELGTFLGKQKYNIGLIDRLTSFYDCKDADSERTIGRGLQEYENIYVTLFAATTRDGLEASVPAEAFGSGFMSRVVLVYAPEALRTFPIPKAVGLSNGKGIPWAKELQKRLAWVSEKSLGEFHMDEETTQAYDKWYRAFKQGLASSKDEQVMLLRSRYDTHLLKLMLIIRAQRYDIVLSEEDNVVGRTITIEDFRDAKSILDATYSDSGYSIEDAAVENEWTRKYNQVKGTLKKWEKIHRRDLLPRMSGYGCKASEVDGILNQLVEEGVIDIFDSHGTPLVEAKTSEAGTLNKEMYVWKKKEIAIHGLKKSFASEDSQNV